MRITWVLLTGLAVAAGGCGGPEGSAGAGPLGSSAQPIIAGTVDTGDPAIVELVAINGQMAAKCTATLVTPHVLLTAAHCIAETPNYRYVVFPGNDDSKISAQNILSVATAVYDPKFGDPRNGHDLAVVVLDKPMAVK